ncbi:hypothetical protein D3C86_2191400 [compost metagenome]
MGEALPHAGAHDLYRNLFAVDDGRMNLRDRSRGNRLVKGRIEVLDRASKRGLDGVLRGIRREKRHPVL